jgi:hypothetical protein
MYVISVSRLGIEQPGIKCPRIEQPGIEFYRIEQTGVERPGVEYSQGPNDFITLVPTARVR